MAISINSNPQFTTRKPTAFITSERVAVWDIPARPERMASAPAVRTLSRSTRTHAPAAAKHLPTRSDTGRVEQWREHGRTLLAGIAAGFVLVVGVTMGIDAESTSGPAAGTQTVTAYTAN